MIRRLIDRLRWNRYLRYRRSVDNCRECNSHVVRFIYIDDDVCYPWLTLCQQCGRRAGDVPQVDLGRDRRITKGNVDDLASRFAAGRDRVRARLERVNARPARVARSTKVLVPE